ncbi:MAG: Tn3 family transposase [Pseudonocardiales bacterium]|nr:Tn3 family transposase [Pseudonocardiales bacterium]
MRETVHFAHLDQTAQILCVTLMVNCIAAFNAGLLSPAVHRLRAAGFPIDDADVSHAGPTMSEHILVHGRYHYDLDRPPKQLRSRQVLSFRRSSSAANGNMRFCNWREPTCSTSTNARRVSLTPSRTSPARMFTVAKIMVSSALHQASSFGRFLKAVRISPLAASKFSSLSSAEARTP